MRIIPGKQTSLRPCAQVPVLLLLLSVDQAHLLDRVGLHLLQRRQALGGPNSTQSLSSLVPDPAGIQVEVMQAVVMQAGSVSKFAQEAGYAI